MQTTLLLMARYDGAVIIPIAAVCRDFFPSFGTGKAQTEDIGRKNHPADREDGFVQPKVGLGVHVNHLAAHLDKQTEAARKECRQLSGVAS